MSNIQRCRYISMIDWCLTHAPTKFHYIMVLFCYHLECSFLNWFLCSSLV